MLNTDNLSILSEFLANPDSSVESQRIYKLLDKEFQINPASSKTQSLLNQFVVSIGDDVAGSSSNFVKTETFKSLSNSSKATVIRDVIGVGTKIGFDRSANISKIVYDAIFKEKGLSYRSVLGTLDEKRFNEIIKISIGDALDGNNVKAANFMTGSLGQLVKEGNRQTISVTGYEMRKNGIRIGSKRMTTSSKPCDYCQERSGMIVDLGLHKDRSSKEVELFQFHDNCHCELEVVVL